MPPPPPPSASYLLVLHDTSSSEEDEQEHDDDDQPTSHGAAPPTISFGKDHADKLRAEEEEEGKRIRATATTSNESVPEKATVEAQVTTTIQEEPDGTDKQPAESSATATTEKKKIKKKKKKRHKRRTKKTKGAAAVNFSTVSVREHGRCLGSDVVPLDGAWPLGLSNQVVREQEFVLDDFEEQRQADLRERWNAKFGANKGGAVKGAKQQDAGKDENGTVLPEMLETRQYDYKKKIKGEPDSHKNPLFGMLPEQDRMKLLLHESNDGDGIRHSTTTATAAAPPSPTPKKHPYKTRSGRSSRSLSNVDKYEYNDTYGSTHVKHVRNELEQIRNRRGLEHVGCSCHKAKHRNHKKRQQHRMTERKVKEELRKRGRLPKEPKSKRELETVLQECVETEPCCWGDDCPCVRNGIGCHADVCRCWRHDPPWTTIQELEQQCGNRHGIYVVNVEEINAARRPYYCQPTTKHAQTTADSTGSQE